MKTIIQYSLIASVLGLGLASSGCVVRAGVRSNAYVEEPTLAYVSPGVWVIEDYHEPVFYSDNYYWAYRGGVWYRSGYYSGGWVRVYSVPTRVGHIHRPHNYVRYRAPANVRKQPIPRVRDHRDNRAQPAPPPRGNTRVPATRGTPPRTPVYGRPAAPAPRNQKAYKAPPPKKAPKKAPAKKAPKKSKSRDHR